MKSVMNEENARSFIEPTCRFLAELPFSPFHCDWQPLAPPPLPALAAPVLFLCNKGKKKNIFNIILTIKKFYFLMRRVGNVCVHNFTDYNLKTIFKMRSKQPKRELVKITFHLEKIFLIRNSVSRRRSRKLRSIC